MCCFPNHLDPYNHTQSNLCGDATFVKLVHHSMWQWQCRGFLGIPDNGLTHGVDRFIACVLLHTIMIHTTTHTPMVMQLPSHRCIIPCGGCIPEAFCGFL